jgi:hypothetical protein
MSKIEAWEIRRPKRFVALCHTVAEPSRDSCEHTDQRCLICQRATSLDHVVYMLLA